jgi:hypothetical protein
MRRVVMTPTFATSLGVVIAAVLASASGQGGFRFTGPDRGIPCPFPHCATPSPVAPASARPGSPLRTPQQEAPAGGSGRQAPAPATHHPQPANVWVAYQTIGQDRHGSFYGQIELTSRSGQQLHNWVFRFTYPSRRIQTVWPGQLPHGTHTATVTSQEYGHVSSWSHGVVIIVVSVTGPPGPPAGCAFDGHPCHYLTGRSG